MTSSSVDTPSAPYPTRTFTLAAEHELRFETPATPPAITLTLSAGSAELFGIELALNHAYSLPSNFNAAVFTWYGCTLSLCAPQEVMAYTATDTPMPSYISAHAVLQSRRKLAKVAGLPGPRAVVVGPKDSGKTTLVSILSSYCVRANTSCIAVDVDPNGCGVGLGMPASVCVSVVKHLDLEEDGLIHDNKQVVWVGHEKVAENERGSVRAFESVGNILDSVLDSGSMMGWTGCIADTSGDVDGPVALRCTMSVVKALKADVVFVVGSERLYAAVKTELSNGVECVQLMKSGGVVSREESVRMQMRERRIRAYFYGLENRLSPFSTVLAMDDVVVLKVGGKVVSVPDSVLPIGAESTLDPLKPVRVGVEDVLHAILGVSQAEKEDQVLEKPVYGFVHVVKIDADRNCITVLSPSPGKIPSNFLLAGDVKWIE